jgi:sirohydrochlorin ferrochelatase
MSTNRSLTVLVVFAMVIMTSVIVFAAIDRTLPAPPTSDYAPGEVQRLPRVQDAEIVRWAAMGEAYARAEQLIQRASDVNATRVQDAEIVRWAAMGEAYAKAEQLIQRARDVNATR